MSFWDKVAKGVSEVSKKVSGGEQKPENKVELTRPDIPLYDKAPEAKVEKESTTSVVRPSEVKVLTPTTTQNHDQKRSSTFSNRSTERPGSSVKRTERPGASASKTQIEIPSWIGDFASDPTGTLFTGEGVLNPENWWLVGDTEEDKARKAEQSGYRAENPMDENAMDGIVTGEDYLDRYNQYFDDNGGIDDEYESAWSSFGKAMSGNVGTGMNRNGTDTFQMSESAVKSIPDTLKKVADESLDDGTNRRENRKAMMMSGAEYIRQREAGFPGRPVDQIDPDAVYSKLDEMSNWNYVPYIEDEDQRHLWDFQNMGNDVSNFFKELADVREDWTDATVDYNGQPLSKRQLDRRLADYILSTRNDPEYDSKFIESKDRNNPDIEDYATPMRYKYTFGSGDDAEVMYGDFHAQMTGNGDEIAVWFGEDTDNAWIFDDEADLDANLSIESERTTEDDPNIAMYANLEPLTYQQYDGTEVSIPFYDAVQLAMDLDEGKADVDYGPLNIAKDPGDLSDLTEFNFGDWVPKIIDMTTGSMPLFIGQTAWPMAIGNAITSAQGLDPQGYDQSSGEYKRLASDITADQLAASVALSSLMPLTEKFAGNLGHGAFNGPVSKIVEKAGISPLANYPLGVVGEGVEEGIAGAWEEIQSMGWDEAFGNEILDEEGKPVFDETDHAIKDPNTPIQDRIENYIETIPENFMAGMVLGGALSAPQIIGDATTGSGYVGQHRYDRALRELERDLGLPRYKVAKKGNKDFVITPEIMAQNRRD